MLPRTPMPGPAAEVTSPIPRTLSHRPKAILEPGFSPRRVDNSDSPRFEDPRRMRGLRALGRSSESRVRTARRTHRSGGIPLMSTGSDLIAMITSRQNLADYQKKHWHGTFAEYLDIVRQRPQGHPDRLSAPLRHDPQPRHRGGRRQQGEARPLQVLRRPRSTSGQDAIFGLERTADEPGQHPQERRATATAPSGACCCCTGPSAAPRARSPGS